MRKQLNRSELEKIKGGAISSAQCKYLWATCIAYPQGCTNPCALWKQMCT